MTNLNKLCEVENCNQVAKWSLFWTKADGKKYWVSVCDRHEQLIARENLKEAGGYIGQYAGKLLNGKNKGVNYG